MSRGADLRAASRFGVRFTPHGHLPIEPTADGAECDDPTTARLVQALARGNGPGLLQLWAGEVGRPLPPSFAWWRGFAARYVAALSITAKAGPASGRVLKDDDCRRCSGATLSRAIPRSLRRLPPHHRGQRSQSGAVRNQPRARPRARQRAAPRS